MQSGLTETLHGGCVNFDDFVDLKFSSGKFTDKTQGKFSLTHNMASAILNANAAANAIAGSNDAIPWRQCCHFFAMSSEGSS